jgi:hypothetical protein
MTGNLHLKPLFANDAPNIVSLVAISSGDLVNQVVSVVGYYSVCWHYFVAKPPRDRKLLIVSLPEAGPKTHPTQLEFLLPVLPKRDRNSHSRKRSFDFLESGEIGLKMVCVVSTY